MSDLVERLEARLVPIVGTIDGKIYTTGFESDRLCTEAAARIRELEAALQWYGEQSRLARLVHIEGDAGRNAIVNDGGDRARQALGGDHG